MCNLFRNVYIALWKLTLKPSVMACQPYNYRIQYDKNIKYPFSLLNVLYTDFVLLINSAVIYFFFFFFACEFRFISTSHIRIQNAHTSNPNIQIPTWPIAKVQYCVFKPYIATVYIRLGLYTRLQQQSIKIFLFNINFCIHSYKIKLVSQPISRDIYTNWILNWNGFLSSIPILLYMPHEVRDQHNANIAI